MVILGGLEVVIGGYLIHKYHKNKKEDQRLSSEAERQNFEAQHIHQQRQQMPKRSHTSIPPEYKGRPHRKGSSSYTPHTQPRPYPAQPLRRYDSFASLSQMPVANGRQPQSAPQWHPTQNSTPLPPHPQLQQAAQMGPNGQPQINYPYYNTGFSASYPSFEPSSDQMGPNAQIPGGRHTTEHGRPSMDGVLEHEPHSPHVHFAPSLSTDLGERDDPPPPYRA